MQKGRRSLGNRTGVEEADREDVSPVREPDQVIAVLCSDIHLSLKPPRARRKEPDWFEAMLRPLKELAALAVRYKAPILCAGDIFDHWRAEPELINFALCYLPEMIAVPGQHDLPLHNLGLLKRSAFWSLVLAKKIVPVFPERPYVAQNGIVVHGFPYGVKVTPFDRVSKRYHIAVCHDYFWMGAQSFPGAPPSQEARAFRDKIHGYHAVVFGDNHKGFLTTVNGIRAFNCGTLMRRASDEVDYRPMVGLLCKSGAILTHKLHTRKDKFITLAQEDKELRKTLRAHDLTDFITGLTELQQKSFDFIAAIEVSLKRIPLDNRVRRLVLEALGREE